jgi:hypothetical protein
MQYQPILKIDDQLYLRFAAVVDCGISESYLSKAKSVKASCWTFINDPSDKRKVLVQYETMKEKYRLMVEKRFGNPYEYVAKQPIRELVEKDAKAEEFYFAYRFDVDKSLPVEHIKAYSIAASWLNMLIKCNSDKKFIKKHLNLRLDEFYTNVCEIIKTDKIELPATYQRLRNKMKEYEEKGYSSLIDWRFGNSFAKKVNDQVCESVLFEFIAHPNQHDDAIISKVYNDWAAANGYEQITRATVGNYRRKNYFQLQAQREGNAAWYNKFGKHIIRKRPSAPLLLIGSDDNDLDLYFKEEKLNSKGAFAINYYHRYKLIVVMDAFNDYILGYAYGDTVTTDLVKAAYLDAMHHIRELTGRWYLMHQVQTDHWAIKSLEPFYKAIATYTPATARSPRSKYIEQGFGDRWHQQLKFYPNYAGTNITSKFRINRDNLEVVKKSFPTKDEAYLQIEDFITRMRLLVDDKTGISRQQHWIDAFNASEVSQERMISDGRMLMLFGTPHEYTNTITNGGIRITVDGLQRIYDIPDELYLQNVGKKVQVIYDPYDYSRVLVTDNEKLRFVAQEYDKLPSALKDYNEGDRSRLNQRLEQKRNHVLSIAANKDKRQEIQERNRLNAESLLQAQVMHKETKQLVESVYQGNTDLPFDPLSQM